MPRRDGTGPMGLGPLSGRGLGFCIGANVGDYGVGFGRGIGRGIGFGRGIGHDMRFVYGCRRDFGRYYDEELIGLTDKEILTKQKELLQKRLDLVGKQLENLTEAVE